MTTIFIDDGEKVKVYPVAEKVAKAVATLLGTAVATITSADNAGSEGEYEESEE